LLSASRWQDVDPAPLYPSADKHRRNVGFNRYDRLIANVMFHRLFGIDSFESSETDASLLLNASLATCEPGALAASHQLAILYRINAYRYWASLPAVRLDAVKTKRNQASALVVAANREALHDVTSDMICFTPEAKYAASRSNLAHNLNGVQAIDGYMVRNPSSHPRNMFCAYAYFDVSKRVMSYVCCPG
jgi:hypothetical protein